MRKRHAWWLAAALTGCGTTATTTDADTDAVAADTATDAMAADTDATLGSGDAAVDIAAASTSAQLINGTAVTLLYSQGIARLPNGWAFSAKAGLWRTDDTFTELVALVDPLPASLVKAGYTHIGDIDVYDGKLYAGLEQGDFSLGKQAVAWFDLTTLEFLGSVDLAQHENPCLCIDSDTHIAYTPDRYHGDSINRWDVAAGWKPLPPLQFSRKLDAMQGVDVADGALWFSCDDDAHGLYRVDLKTGEVTQIGTVGRQDGADGATLKPEVEGIDATHLGDAFLWTLTDDPTRATSWVDAWHLPAK